MEMEANQKEKQKLGLQDDNIDAVQKKQDRKMDWDNVQNICDNVGIGVFSQKHPRKNSTNW